MLKSNVATFPSTSVIFTVASDIKSCGSSISRSDLFLSHMTAVSEPHDTSMLSWMFRHISKKTIFSQVESS